MKILKYIPSVIFSIIEIFLVWSILSNSQYSSESQIMATLAILYATICLIGINTGLHANQVAIGLASDLTVIKNRLNINPDPENELDKVKEGFQKVNNAEIKFLIRGFSEIVVLVIGIIYLFNI